MTIEPDPIPPDLQTPEEQDLEVDITDYAARAINVLLKTAEGKMTPRENHLRAAEKLLDFYLAGQALKAQQASGGQWSYTGAEAPSNDA